MNQSKVSDVALLILRVGVGLVMMYYGSQKMFGLFGGSGFQGTIQGMGEGKHIPPLFATLAMIGEFAGGLGLAIGLLTRVAGFGMMCTMAVATYFQATAIGAIQDALDGKPGAANMIFFPFVLCLVGLFFLLVGGGTMSLDAKLFRRRSSK